ncbi:aminotransferase class I/II-fold pyridoxal phosphate-dependent enzyme, partial [Thioclava sp. BHET1]
MNTRDGLMAGLRKSHAQGSAPAPLRNQDKKRTDFKTLPGYRQLQLGFSEVEALGIEKPFFRQIDAVRGTQVQIAGQWVENFASYDYLSLNRSDLVRGAVQQAVAEWGVSTTASRLVGGDYSFHLGLEARLAAFLGHEAALAMISGHGTNQAILRTLMGPDDLIVVDSLAHNSIYEGIRLSGAAHVS